MRILYLTDYSGIGGGEKSLLYLCDYENKKGEDIMIVTLFNGKLNKEASSFEIKNKYLHPKTVSYRGWYKGFPFFSPSTISKLGLLLKEFNPEIIHIYSSGRMLSSLMFLSKFVNAKIFWTCHGNWERPFGLKRILLSRFIKKVFFVSEYVRQSSTFSEDKEIISYLGVPECTAKKGRDNYVTKKTVAVIGRFQAIKNQKAIVELLKGNRYDDISFYLIGDSEFGSKKDINYRENIIYMIEKEKLSNIKVFSYDENVFDSFPEIDLLLVPSLFETFSLVTVEAIGRGILVVATKNGGPSEILQGGEYGFLFDPYSIKEMKEVLDLALKSEVIVNKLIRRAKVFSIENYYGILRRNYVGE